MVENSQTAQLRERILTYTAAVAAFERDRERMLGRRRSAKDGVMVIIDENLQLNARALASLRRVLDAAKEELRRTEESERRRASRKAAAETKNGETETPDKA